MVAASLPVSFPFRRHASLLAGLLFFLFGCRLLTGAEVTATLAPESIPAGEGANLTIRITNGDVTAIKAPEVAGLIMNGPNESRQMRIVNGVRTSAMTLTYAVGSMTAGEYAIPPFTLTVDGAPVETQPFKLTVTPSANQTPAGLPMGGSSNAQGSTAAPAAGEDNFGFLTLDFAGRERQHAWVGEIAPVRIMAWLPEGARVSLNTPLQPTGSSFTLHNVSNKPQQDSSILQGRRYTTVTWYGSLSFTKAGTYPPDLSMKITVQVPDPNSRRQSSGNAFFDQMTGPQMIPKEVVLRNKTDQSAHLEIRALPTSGKPADFAGAVGKFAFGRSQIPTEWATGEPQQIVCEVAGEGNFTLLAQPGLVSDKKWKSYEGQSRFAAGDAASFSGTTTFSFNQVPREAGLQQVRLAFSFFNPETISYQTAETSPQSVQVSGTDLPAELEATVAAPNQATAPPPPPALAPQRTRQGYTSSLSPPAWRPGFRYFLTGILLILVSGIALQGLRSRLSDPRRRADAARHKALDQAMQEANHFAACGDVRGFFAAARRALQQHLSPLWQRPAPAITLGDVSQRVAPDSPIFSIFREADRQEFSPMPTLGPAELPGWKARLEQALTLSS